MARKSSRSAFAPAESNRALPLGQAATIPKLKTLASLADIADGVAALKRICPGMRRAHGLTGDPPLRRWTDGFDGLVRIVIGQQLSLSSANAIHARLVTAVAPMTAPTLAATSDETLRKCGLSAAKIATLRAMSLAVTAKELDFVELAQSDEQTVREALTRIRGIGPWTADIYLMFCRGDGDAFAPGDLALQIGVAHLFDLRTRPTTVELSVIAERWRPWRGVAARMIWAYYGAIKSNDTRAQSP